MLIFVHLTIDLMKKLIAILLLALCATVASAQNSDEGTLKFLGIPVDGTKDHLVEKIKAKGFKYNSFLDCLSGQFNGRDVDVYVVDNHGVAYRVFVAFPETSEYNIRSEFNHLLSQFLRNDKYVPMRECEVIDQKEDISYEMTVNKKQYGASFAYISPDIFTPEQTRIIHDFVEKAKTMSEAEMKNLSESLAASFITESEASSPEEILASMNRISSLLSGNVWFKILRDGSDYQIGLYYDNIKNMPNGEDL